MVHIIVCRLILFCSFFFWIFFISTDSRTTQLV